MPLHAMDLTALALPAVKSLEDCADFGKTVAPFVPQLQDLPARLVQSWSNLDELKALYLSTNPFLSGLAIALALSPIFLVTAEINRNYSQVDRMWSILPTLYHAHYALYAHLSGLTTQRLDTILMFSAIWSVSGLAKKDLIVGTFISPTGPGTLDFQLLP